jgi:isoleucyl-tRNA synthetase
VKFPEYKKLDLVNICSETNQFWKNNKIFQKSIDLKKNQKRFVFYEGPPSANGLPGIHHIMARLIKDTFCRYKTLTGHLVERKAGWDTHGLPVELSVEKTLGIKKDDIGKTISIEDYNQECRSSVMKYTAVWNDLTDKMGYWVDVDSPYITYTNKYIESVWFLIKRLYDKSLIYQGYTIQPYSPAAGTGLSSHELNQPGCYKNVKDLSVVALFKVSGEQVITKGLNNVFFMAWTTTPWTLFSNTGLAVGNKIKYSIIETLNPYTKSAIVVICATDCISSLFNPLLMGVELDTFDHNKISPKNIPYRIVNEVDGTELVDLRYEQILNYIKPQKNKGVPFRVVSADFVTTKDGTGIVHLAPTFGADDFLVAKKKNLPLMLIKNNEGKDVPLVDLSGRLVSGLGEFSGRFVKSAFDDNHNGESVDIDIAVKLKQDGLIFKTEKYEHSYPHCWRTDKPILYYPLDSWFVKSTQYRDLMIEKNKEINWKPKSTGEGRFENWLENINDWNLSRSRFWGIPLPIWRSQDKTEEVCVGSVLELKKLCELAVRGGHMKDNPLKEYIENDMSEENYSLFDLHKNYVDDIVLLSASGKPLFREKDVIDVWFDSGSMPYAQWHYPFENKEMIDSNEFFPADFIAEGVDQTRGWFFTLHAISVMCFESVAYKNVVSNGLVLDAKGQKMSKRLGNTVDPFEIMSTHGADSVRWYMTTNSQPWENLKFSTDGVIEVKQKYFSTIYNIYSFFVLYANIDEFRFTEPLVKISERPIFDQWIVSELHTLIEEVTLSYEQYEPTRAGRLIQSFVVEKLSNWYVRLCRRRFWKGSYDQNKISAYQSLYECLIVISKLSCPIAPFFMDRLFCDLNSISKLETLESVHLSSFPKSNPLFISKELEEKMELVKTICSLALSLRKREKIRVRQPLRSITIQLNNSSKKKGVESLRALILSELNIKELIFSDKSQNIVKRSLRVNFPVLGKKHGPLIKLIIKAVSSLVEKEVEEFESCGKISLTIDGGIIVLEGEDLIVTSEDMPGFLTAKTESVLVALNTQISKDLHLEGLSREFINKIQSIRKEMGLVVTSKIRIIVFVGGGEFEEAINFHRDHICEEVLADGIIIEKKAPKTNYVFEFNNYKMYIAVDVTC